MFFTQPKTISMNTSLIRKFTVLFVLSALLVTVISCSKEDDEPSGPTTGVEGNWKFTAVYSKTGDKEDDISQTIKTSAPCFFDIVLKFSSNGLISASVPAACQSVVSSFIGNINESKYEIKDGNLTIKDSTNGSVIMTGTLNGNQMSWVYSSSSRFVLTKQ